MLFCAAVTTRSVVARLPGWLVIVPPTHTFWFPIPPCPGSRCGFTAHARTVFCGYRDFGSTPRTTDILRLRLRLCRFCALPRLYAVPVVLLRLPCLPGWLRIHGYGLGYHRFLPRCLPGTTFAVTPHVLTCHTHAHLPTVTLPVAFTARSTFLRVRGYTLRNARLHAFTDAFTFYRSRLLPLPCGCYTLRLVGCGLPTWFCRYGACRSHCVATFTLRCYHVCGSAVPHRRGSVTRYGLPGLPAWLRFYLPDYSCPAVTGLHVLRWLVTHLRLPAFTVRTGSVGCRTAPRLLMRLRLPSRLPVLRLRFGSDCVTCLRYTFYGFVPPRLFTVTAPRVRFGSGLRLVGYLPY